MRVYFKFRFLWCYLLILVWVVILVFFLSYWKDEPDKSSSTGPLPLEDKHSESNSLGFEDRRRYKKSQVHCNSPERIRLGHEGQLPENYKLLGLIILIRHGDRGPMRQVQNLSSIDCGYKSFGTPLYNKYSADIFNISKLSSYSEFVGSFNNYPILPSSARCSVGNLTPIGVIQHLKLGETLKSLYFDTYSLLSHPWKSDDISITSTNYLRTFQSALAFLYGFLPSFDPSILHIKRGNGLYCCTDYCDCKKAILYESKHEKDRRDYRLSHPSILELLSTLSPIVQANSFEESQTTTTMFDSLLAYCCHAAKFPCMGKRCATLNDLGKLISFEDWENRQRSNLNKIKGAKLRMYGLLKEIQSSLSSLINYGKPKINLFSAHDKTIVNLLNSFQIPHYHPPYYASRVIFEVYENKTVENSNSLQAKHFFRIIYNGKDITKLVPFCSSITVKQINSGNIKMSNLSLCKITDFDKFLEAENFFKMFNSTDFESSCKLV